MKPLALTLCLALAAPPALAAPGAGDTAAAEVEEPRPWYWLAFGVAGMGLVVGGLMHSTALDTRAAAERIGPSRERTSLVDDYETERATAYVGYGIALAAVGVGLYLIFAPGAGIDDPPATLEGGTLTIRW